MRTNKLTLDDVIDSLVENKQLDEFIEEMEKEGVNIDPTIDDSPTISSLGKDLHDFTVNDKHYELSMDWMLLQNRKMFVEINFRLKNLKQLKKLAISNSHLETGITGTGDAKKVFDKVISLVVKRIQAKHPDYITFQAREENRQRTYKYMIKQVLRKVGDYKQIDISPLTNEKVESDEFWLEKI